MHTICIQYAYNMHTICIQYAYNTHTICIQDAYKMHTRCIQYAYKMHTRCIQDAYKIHREYIQTGIVKTTPSTEVACSLQIEIKILKNAKKTLKNQKSINAQAIKITNKPQAIETYKKVINHKKQ